MSSLRALSLNALLSPAAGKHRLFWRPCWQWPVPQSLPHIAGGVRSGASCISRHMYAPFCISTLALVGRHPSSWHARAPFAKRCRLSTSRAPPPIAASRFSHADALGTCSAAMPFRRQGGTFCSHALLTAARFEGAGGEAPGRQPASHLEGDERGAALVVPRRPALPPPPPPRLAARRGLLASAKLDKTDL
jgi:hypothetical protein